VPDRNDLEDVVVWIDEFVVGRLRREDAVHLSATIDEACARGGPVICKAVIRGGWDRGGGEIGLFGVALFVP